MAVAGEAAGEAWSWSVGRGLTSTLLLQLRKDLGSPALGRVRSSLGLGKCLLNE